MRQIWSPRKTIRRYKFRFFNIWILVYVTFRSKHLFSPLIDKWNSLHSQLRADWILLFLEQSWFVFHPVSFHRTRPINSSIVNLWFIWAFSVFAERWVTCVVFAIDEELAIRLAAFCRNLVVLSYNNRFWLLSSSWLGRNQVFSQCFLSLLFENSHSFFVMLSCHTKDLLFSRVGSILPIALWLDIVCVSNFLLFPVLESIRDVLEVSLGNLSFWWQTQG